jgi:RNA polymerase sigma factor (sigma-70 family)
VERLSFTYGNNSEFSRDKNTKRSTWKPFARVYPCAFYIHGNKENIMIITDLTGTKEEKRIINEMALAIALFTRGIPSIGSRVQAVSERLKKYAIRYAVEKIIADDLYQVAVEEIITHCSPTDNDTYMLRLADWRMKNTIKRERSYSCRIEVGTIKTDADDGESECFEFPDMTGLPEEKFRQRELSSKLQQIFSSLKQEQKELVLMLMDGLSHREIARRLQTSQQLISYHVGKIRAQFEQAGMSPSREREKIIKSPESYL